MRLVHTGFVQVAEQGVRRMQLLPSALDKALATNDDISTQGKLFGLLVKAVQEDAGDDGAVSYGTSMHDWQSFIGFRDYTSHPEDIRRFRSTKMDDFNASVRLDRTPDDIHIEVDVFVDCYLPRESGRQREVYPAAEGELRRIFGMLEAVAKGFKPNIVFSGFSHD